MGSFQSEKIENHCLEYLLSLAAEDKAWTNGLKLQHLTGIHYALAKLASIKLPEPPESRVDNCIMDRVGWDRYTVSSNGEGLHAAVAHVIKTKGVTWLKGHSMTPTPASDTLNSGQVPVSWQWTPPCMW